jgi:hypothetical protein
LCEPGFEEFAQLGCRPELRNRIQFLEGRSERVGETPDCSRFELLILALEVEVMHAAGEVFGGFQFALDERLLDDHLRRDVGQFAPLPSLHLLSQRLEIPPHPVNADRNAVDQ